MTTLEEEEEEEEELTSNACAASLCSWPILYKPTILLVCIMDNSRCNSSTSNNHTACGGVDMTMEGLILHDQLPYDLIYPNYPLDQTHQIIPITPSHVLNPEGFPGNNQLGISQRSEEQKEAEPEEEEEVEAEEEAEEEEELGAMKEMLYKIAAMQPVDIDPATIQKPKRRNVRISNDPQSVAARHRRERISEKIRILQRLVPGGTKMDTATMLDEAIRYVKFLKRQVHQLQSNDQSSMPLPPPPPPHNNNINIGGGGGVMGRHYLSAMDCEALGITPPFSSSVQPPAVEVAGFTIGATVGGDIPCDTLRFNHQLDEVIRVNDFK